MHATQHQEGPWPHRRHARRIGGVLRAITCSSVWRGISAAIGALSVPKIAAPLATAAAAAHQASAGRQEIVRERALRRIDRIGREDTSARKQRIEIALALPEWAETDP
ncbi:MAG: hypothetical protein WA324_18375 [Bryobacteraceae bacterium]